MSTKLYFLCTNLVNFIFTLKFVICTSFLLMTLEFTCLVSTNFSRTPMLFKFTQHYLRCYELSQSKWTGSQLQYFLKV